MEKEDDARSSSLNRIKRYNHYLLRDKNLDINRTKNIICSRVSSET